MSAVSFSPIYLANFKEQPNPFSFLYEQRLHNRKKMKLLYSKVGFTDPFHIHVDLVIVAILCAIFDVDHRTATTALTLAFLLGAAEITYTAVMTFVFKRAPVFVSDWSLIKSGWVIWKHNRHWLILGLVTLVCAYCLVGYALSAWTFSHTPPSDTVLLAVMMICLPPTFYNWRIYSYSQFFSRTLYSSILHALRNIMFGNRVKPLLTKDREFFRQRNLYTSLELENAPDFVHICMESYGAIVHRNQDFRDKLLPFLKSFERTLSESGIGCVSHYSTSTIFTGGSWLSYCSFMYGIRIDDIHLHDCLFQQNASFSAYESIFHVLKRNNYSNVLVAPMGGVDTRDVSWDQIRRCFQADVIVDWETMDFQGRTLKFLGQTNRFCPPDQYSLNFSYKKAKQEVDGSFSLFFCTLNSHIPWHSPVNVEADWRELNDPAYSYSSTVEVPADMTRRYLDALVYQLGITLDFLLNTAHDSLIVVVFGDHQPPMIATEYDGRDTPVHVFCKDLALLECFKQNGFEDGLILSQQTTEAMNHEGYMSILMRALQRVYGKTRSPEIQVMPRGTNLSVTPEEKVDC